MGNSDMKSEELQSGGCKLQEKMERSWRLTREAFIDAISKVKQETVLVDADEYVKHLPRYIHLNPVRARMVEHYRG